MNKLFNTTSVVNINNTKDYDVYIGRGSKWGNPFKIGEDGTRKEVLKKYLNYVLNNKKLLDELPELQGKTLGCYCAPSPCHGNILINLLEERVINNNMNELPEIKTKTTGKCKIKSISKLEPICEDR